MTRPADYPAAIAAKRMLENAYAVVCDAMKKYARDPVTGLTPDAVKASPDWRVDKARCDSVFAELQAFNRWFMVYHGTRYRREHAAQREARARANATH